MKIFWIRYSKYVLPILFAIFMGFTIWSIVRGDLFATLLFYLLFDALLGTMWFHRAFGQPLVTFIMYVVFFSVLTVLSFALVGGWVFMIVLIIDFPVAVLAYQAYGEIY